MNIKNIQSQNIEKKNSTQVSLNNKYSSVPKSIAKNDSKNYSDYSTANLQATYLPAKVPSFKGIKTEQTSVVAPAYGYNTNPINPNVVTISSLPETAIFNGDFYKEMSEDLATSVRSSQNVFLEKEKGVSAEIFAHNFAKNVKNLFNEGKNSLGKNAEVIYISDLPSAIDSQLGQEANYMLSLAKQAQAAQIENKKIKEAGGEPTAEALAAESELQAKLALSMQLQKVAPEQQSIMAFDKIVGKVAYSSNNNKILIVDNFEEIGTTMQAMGIKLETYFEQLKNAYPNLYFVPTATKQDPPASPFEKPKGYAIPEGLHKLSLSGLSVTEAKEFLNKNKHYVEQVSEKYAEASVHVTEEAIDEAVTKSVATMDDALPTSTMKLLDFAIASKINNADRKLWDITLEAKDVSDIVNNHAEVLKSFANKAGFDIVENPPKMEDLAGLKDAKLKMDDIYEYVKDPKAFAESGRKISSGFLFYGPPGTGKTEFARAFAGNIKDITGKDVPFFNVPKIGDKYVNSGQNEIIKKYEDARAYCKKIGAKFGVIFMDEGDAICKKISNSSDAGASEDAKVTNAFKAQLDGFASKGDDIKIFTIVTTNSNPDTFDDALLRPSRLRKIEFGLPETKKDRYDLLNIHARKKPFANEASKADLLSRLADVVKGMNGDQMTQVLDEATRLALLKKDNKVIGMKELNDAFINTIAGPKSERDYSEADKILASIHEAGHAEAASTLKQAGKLMAITNEPRGGAAAITWTMPSNKMCESYNSIIDQIAMLHGGGAAEVLLNGSHDSGVSNDFSKCSQLTNYALKKGALGIYTPEISFYDVKGHEFEELSKRYGKELQKDSEIMLETAQRKINQLLNAHKSFILGKYMQDIKDAVAQGKDGRNYLAEEYINERTEWLKQTGEIKAEPVLDSALEAFTSISRTDKFWEETAKVENARNLMSDGVEKILRLSQNKDWLNDASKTPDQLAAKINDLVDFAKNGKEWLDGTSTNEENNIQDQFKKAIKSIVDSATSSETKVSAFKKIKNVLKRI